MGKTAFIYHEDYELHDTGDFHPETSSRARHVYEHVKRSEIVDDLEWIRPEPIETSWIETVHSRDYRLGVEEACITGRSVLDLGDTRICHDSYRIALLSSGAAAAGVDAVMNGQCANAFCCVRPPGHHARPEEAMGFCLFNNIAIAARYAQQKYGLERVLIIDPDVHHGNGTEEMFYDDDTVMFFSTHQYPYYPGTGAADSTGSGKGKGFTVNAPMASGAGIAEYRRAFDELLRPAAERFKPDIVLVSAGFDAHRDDPLASINLTDDDFAELTKIIHEIAQEHCEGRLVSMMEGGYNLDALARAAKRHISVLCGKE